MKLLMENWRIYEQQMLWEQEYEQFFNEHFTIIDEGFVEDVVNAGRQVKDTVVNVIDGMKDWTHEKIVDFVKYMGNKLQQFVDKLKAMGIYKKYRARAETNAIKLLMTNKHIDLGVMIFTAIAKLTGGFIIDKVAKAPEIIEKVRAMLETPIDSFKELVGDISDIVQIIQKFKAWRQDKGTHEASMGAWDDFGGLAEKLGG